MAGFVDSLKMTFISIFGFVVLAAVATVPVGAQFDPLDPACQAANAQDNPICQETSNPDDPLLGSDGVLSEVVNILSIVASIIAVIIIIVSGIRMITSSGDPSAVGTARNTIIYAAIGIVVIVMSRTIVLFIADRLGS